MSEARKKAMQQLGFLPEDQPTAAPEAPSGGSTREQAMQKLGFIKPEGPEIVYPDEIDDAESKKISTLDRVLALNVGDPSGVFKKLKEKYSPQGLAFSQSTEGDIVFKSKDSPKWSRLDPGVRDTSNITSLGGLVPNKMYTGDPVEFAQDVADVAPDIAQGVATSAAQGAGGLAFGLPGATFMGGLAGGLGEGARQVLGKATGFRERFEPGQIAMQAGIDATTPLLLGSGLSKNQIEAAVAKRGPLTAAWDAMTGKVSPDLGVQILNKAKQGLTDPKLPAELVPEAVRQVKENTQGFIPAAGAWAWEGVSRMTPDIKARAFSKIKPAALDILEKSGVKFGAGVKPPKTLAEAAPFVSTQGRAGEMVKVITEGARKAREEKLSSAGAEIEDALSKVTNKIDLSDERNIFDDAISALEEKKKRDPMEATQSDKLIAAIRKARESVFGAPEESVPLDELRKQAANNMYAKGMARPSAAKAGDELYSTAEAATGRLKTAIEAVDSMSPEELQAAAGLPVVRDIMGTPMTPPPLSKEAKAKIVENTYYKMFGTKPRSEAPAGSDAKSVREWAVSNAQKMTRSELIEATGQYPGKSAKVDPDIAWSKFLTLKEMGGLFKRGDNNADLVNGALMDIANRAERSLDKKMYNEINGVAGKDLSKQYKIYVRGDEDTSKLLTSIDRGLSTAGKAFTDKGHHIRTAIKEYDDLYGTNMLDQLEVLSVAKDFGTKGEWFPVSASGATSTGINNQGSNMLRNAAGSAAGLLGIGGAAKEAIQGAGEVAGGMAGSSAAVRRAARLGNFLDQVYGRAGGDWNPVSTATMVGSPWMNLDNTDQRQNRDLLKERYGK